MPINNLTARVIQRRGDAIKCSAGGPAANGRYVGWITLWEDRGTLPGGLSDLRPTPLVSTEPEYETPEAAKAAMEAVVAAIREDEPVAFADSAARSET